MNIRAVTVLLAVALLSPNAVNSRANDVRRADPGRVGRLRDRLETVSDDYILVAAHRGDWRNAPENSLQAIENSIRMGADIVEIDVRRTKDGHLVLLHDKTLERTTTGQGRVKDWTLEELKKLRLKNGQGVATRHSLPTLREAMLLAKGRILIYLDKTYDYLPETLQVLKETETVQEGIFCGTQSLPELRRRHGDLVDTLIYMPALKETIPRLDDYVAAFETHPHVYAWVTKFKECQSPILQRAKQLRQKGDHVWVGTMWPHECAGHDDDATIDDPDAAWGWVIDQGATILCSDRPRELLEYLRSRGLHD